MSHAPGLIDALQQLPECHSITLEKKFGETVIVGQEPHAVLAMADAMSHSVPCSSFTVELLLPT